MQRQYCMVCLHGLELKGGKISPMNNNPQLGRKLKKANKAWIQPFQDGAGARYQQIARQIVDAVRDGVLRPGDRLPPQRDLAQTMGVDLTTVTRAYTEVRHAGLLDAHGAGGSYIANSLAERDQTVDLGMNIPPLLGSDAFGRMMQTGMAYAQEQLSDGTLMSYHVGAGSKTDREAAATWLEPVLGRISPDRILVCPGGSIGAECDSASLFAAWRRDCRGEPDVPRTFSRRPCVTTNRCLGGCRSRRHASR